MYVIKMDIADKFLSGDDKWVDFECAYRSDNKKLMEDYVSSCDYKAHVINEKNFINYWEIT